MIRYVPELQKKIDKLKWDSRLCVVKAARLEKFQVRKDDDQYVVDLPERTCTCGAWKLSGILCIYATASIIFVRQELDDYVDDCYKKPMYLQSYNWPIEPLNGPKMWPEAEGYPLCPPSVKTMPGRPKVKRKRSVDERQSSNKKGKKGVMMKYSICNGLNHNARSCKAVIPTMHFFVFIFGYFGV